MDYKRKKVIDHLKKAGFEDEQIGMILDVIPIEEAYLNLRRSEVLKKVVHILGNDEVEKRAKRMNMTIDVFAKEFDRWNTWNEVTVTRVSEEEVRKLKEASEERLIKFLQDGRDKRENQE